MPAIFKRKSHRKARGATRRKKRSTRRSKKGGGKTSRSKTSRSPVKAKSYSSPLACSPKHKKIYPKGKTCYTHDNLKDIAKAWNNEHFIHDPIDTDQPKPKLWLDLKKRIKECKTEWCWLDQEFIQSLQNNKELRMTFKPPIPKKKWQWLSTDDIEGACKPYEAVVKDFKFLGAYPIDFASVYYYLFGKFNALKYQKAGYNKIGIVFNEDPHNKSGSHWIALFLDVPKQTAYFFDSYGDPPHPLVERWVNKLRPNFKLKYNRTQHQRANSECGVYVIHFIVRMALGVSFSRIENDIIRDREINAQRKKYFNPFEKAEAYWL